MHSARFMNCSKHSISAYPVFCSVTAGVGYVPRGSPQGHAVQAMDVLSNVLNVTNLATVVLGSRELQAPWGLQIDTVDKSAVHIVRRGSSWLRYGDAEPI